ncbi:MAG: HlyD family efflux transporter periplasmic adaptor subunit [Chloroflexi bacterium]|nr:HlyD family efflux transporter periplasmic adaptor subunit [Chloroflexota bacterium]MBP8058750.1 HlyD family efflux transporter periplasmic adaptor subunit [Chloroflexota bacterium]
MATRPRPQLILLLLAIFFLTACDTGTDRRTGAAAEPTPIPTAVAAARTTYTVARGEVIYSIEAFGRVTPLVEQALVFPLTGVVGQVYIERGDTVQAGDPLADLNTSAWEAELALAQSALAIAQDQLAASQDAITQTRQEAELHRDLAQLDLNYAISQAGTSLSPDEQYQIDRLTILLALAQLEVEALVTDIDPELQAAVDAAALRVAELENILAQATLFAPFTGEITALNLDTGRVVNAGESVGAIADPDQIEVTATLRDDLLAELAEGFAVQITPANNPGQVLAGIIRRLPYPYGSGGETAVTDGDQAVRIQFEAMSEALTLYESGDRVSLMVVVTQHPAVLWLPPAAIRDFNGRKFVVVQEGEVQQRVDVTLGIAGSGRVEILTGVTEGQIIVGQ